MQFKDGSEIIDKRLDRLPKFDERSKNFSIRTIVGNKKLRSYTWRCNAWLNQGAEGACVGFGITHELAARPAEVKNLTNDYARTNIYWEAQKIDPWPGGSYPNATPVYEGTAVIDGVKIAQKLGWMDNYRWALNLEDLKLGVGHHGPAILGIKWFEGMYKPDENGFIKPTGKCVGGHCILCNSINVKKERFTLHNSWGKDWGINGECYISFADLETLLKQQGEAVFFVKRHNKRKIK